MARIGLALAGSIVALVVILPTTWAAAAAGTSDVDVVFCLSPTQRPHLLDAAVALGLGWHASRSDRIVVSSGRELTIDEWKQTRTPEFERTCAALVGASKTFLPIPSPVPSYPKSALWVLLPVVVGAVLTGTTTMAVSIWKDATTRRQALASTLRAAVLAFAQATETYLEAWAGQAGDPASMQAEVHVRRIELLATARRVADEHRRWALPGDLQKLVSTEALGEKLTSGWRQADHQQRQDRAALVRTQLRRIEITAEQVAKALELPRLPHWAFRRTGGQDRQEA
ncbi:MAG TPA: hypothetical protein VFQ77_18635 [Pseudonocardiaceae bacterium]|nr:hypothetical protein [Pseudonocardiaceae bacterium]